MRTCRVSVGELLQSQDDFYGIDLEVDDELAELLDHPPALRSNGEVSRVLSILDELHRERGDA